MLTLIALGFLCPKACGNVISLLLMVAILLGIPALVLFLLFKLL